MGNRVDVLDPYGTLLLCVVTDFQVNNFQFAGPELRTALDRWGGMCEYGRLGVAGNGDAVVVLDCDIADLLIASELH